MPHLTSAMSAIICYRKNHTCPKNKFGESGRIYYLSFSDFTPYFRPLRSKSNFLKVNTDILILYNNINSKSLHLKFSNFSN